MPRFGVRAEKEEELLEQFKKLGIRESELVEKFIRSGGSGGQRLNKVATCVYLKHKPTGIEVKVQKERTQGLNRFHARRLLAQKIAEAEFGILPPKAIKAAKAKRQKARRGRKSKQKYQN